ncbi:hypothetical protein HQ524_04215 [Candidatus Uhrbacteria bacterium]|nr:hypothetical protein [Candidatus Uhrbacteria bacterium]
MHVLPRDTSRPSSDSPALEDRTPVVTGNGTVDSYVVYILSTAFKGAIKIGKAAMEVGLSASMMAVNALEHGLGDKYDQSIVDPLYKATVALGFGFGLKCSDTSSDGSRVMYKHMTLSSILLVQAMAQLDAASRTLVHNLHVDDGASGGLSPGERSEWQSSCVGAMAVVHTVRALEMSGAFQVFLPSVNEDMQWKIDLIAQATDSDFGILFQVKSRYDGTTMCNIVRSDTAQNGDTHFLKGARRFMNDTTGFWVPVNVEVRSNDTYTHPLDEDVLRALKEMARS